MPSMEENLIKRGLRVALSRLSPVEEQAASLRSEVALYDSPHWGDFQKGLEGRLIESMWRLVDEDDPVETRVLQRECRRLRDQIERPEKALAELQNLNRELDAERQRIEGVAGLPNGRRASPAHA